LREDIDKVLGMWLMENVTEEVRDARTTITRR
jgi:hypothetical protein